MSAAARRGASPAVATTATATSATAQRKTLTATPVAAAVPQLTLEDIARDAFRRKFFLDAFADESQALELSFAFLQRVRQYKQLIGKHDALQSTADDIVQLYLLDPPEQLCVFLRTPAVLSFLSRILAVVHAKRSVPDLFSGMEAHVNDRLEKEKFVAFLASPQYQQLCDAVRKRRELPLGEILVDPRRTQLLEQFLAQENGDQIGNLRFWVDVQTVFLPLIQTNAVSVALFEEIQATVRRLYNQYLTEKPSTTTSTTSTTTTPATLIPEAMRKDTLKRVLQLQGEPFSPSRFATLFRPAQEKIWHWMQTTVYPKFQASLFYVALVVETENLESDRQLRKLSEHVQAGRNAPIGAAAVVSPSNPHKLSSVIVPASAFGSSSPSVDAASARFTRVVAAPLSETQVAAYSNVVAMPQQLVDSHLLSIRIVRVTEAAGTRDRPQHQLDHEFHAAHGDKNIASAMESMDYLDFLWNWRQSISLPTGVLAPSPRTPSTVPKPSLRSFSLPSLNNRLPYMYGYALVSWLPSEPWCGDAAGSADSSPLNGNAEFTTAATHQQQQRAVFLPRFTYVLASKPLERRDITTSLRQLADMKETELREQDLVDIFGSLVANATALERPPQPPMRLTPQYSGFYLQPQLSHVTFPVHWIFKELSHQTVLTLLGALLVGKSLLLVSPRPSALVLVAHALVELLHPFDWRHLCLPICPVRTACALADRAFFTSSSSFRGDAPSTAPPYILGLEAELVHLKVKETNANEPRHCIRNSIYSVQRVNLQLQRPSLVHAHASSCQEEDMESYPIEVLQTQSIILDIDADDVYMPERVEIPEFPQPLVRSAELTLKDAMLGGAIAHQDSLIFSCSPCQPGFLRDMLLVAPSSTNDGVAMPAIIDSVRLAMLAFMESLFGDVPLYSCSFRKSFTSGTSTETTTAAADKQVTVVAGNDRKRPETPRKAALETYVIFEADAFLDDKIELGCREFFRHVFQTELFRHYLLRQHARFCVST